MPVSPTVDNCHLPTRSHLVCWRSMSHHSYVQSKSDYVDKLADKWVSFTVVCLPSETSILMSSGVYQEITNATVTLIDSVANVIYIALWLMPSVFSQDCTQPLSDYVQNGDFTFDCKHFFSYVKMVGQSQYTYTHSLLCLLLHLHTALSFPNQICLEGDQLQLTAYFPNSMRVNQQPSYIETA